VIECEPTLSAVVEKVATPPESATVPSAVPPSRNRTFPAGAEPPDVAATVAVKVTLAPVTEGFKELTTDVDVVVAADAADANTSTTSRTRAGTTARRSDTETPPMTSP
jgi:hypothetical protein